MTSLFLAAALDDRPITQRLFVGDERAEPIGEDPANHGFELQADGLAGQYNAPDKQRGGVFGTAKKMARSLKIRAVHP